MSEIGDRIRRSIDGVAPPADLVEIVGSAAPPIRQVTRPVVYAIVVMLGVGVTVSVALLTRGDGLVTTSSSPPLASTAVGAATTTTSTMTSVVPAVTLVPPSGWHDPALIPVITLPACADAEAVAAFIAEEFPDTVGSLESVTPLRAAEAVAMPRFGRQSLFGESVPDGLCLAVGRVDNVTGWAVASADGTVVARGAAYPYESNEVPGDVVGDYYHQSHIGSGHLFSASVDPDGRTLGLVGGMYTILEVPGFVPEGDIYYWGEQLAASLAMRPFVGFDAPVRPGGSAVPVGMGLFEPSGLPEGFGPCVFPGFLLEMSGDGEETAYSAYCDEQAEYLEVWTELGTGGPAVPPDAETVEFRSQLGYRWIADARLNMAVLFEQGIGGGTWLWMTAPDDFDVATLREVMLTTLILQPGIIDGRSGAADFPDSINRETPSESPLLADIVAGDDPEITARLNTFPNPGMDLAATAMTMGATGTEPFDSVDALVRDTGDSIQVIFECGDVYFNATFTSTGQPARDWSLQPGRYEQVLGSIDALLDVIGCMAAG